MSSKYSTFVDYKKYKAFPYSRFKYKNFLTIDTHGQLYYPVTGNLC